MSDKVVAITPTLNNAKSVSSGLGKLYVEQLSSQLDLQFALTLKLMDQNPLIANFDKAALDKLTVAPPKVREATKNSFTDAVNAAVAEAKRIAQRECPITVTIDDEPLSLDNNNDSKKEEL